MIYEDAVKELSSMPWYDAEVGLENIKKYLDISGHPEDNLWVVHVAGTNGKGSVCAFIETILRKADLRTAMFTSPHLVSINERFRINGTVCNNDMLVKAYERVKEIYESNSMILKPLSFVDTVYLMSLFMFNEANVDICIMETGLGGRLDATNTLKPMVSVISSITMDHMNLLGDSIEKIASEKAGIIKEGIPVVAIHESAEKTGCDSDSAFSVIKSKAQSSDSKLFEVIFNTEDHFIIKEHQIFKRDYTSITIHETEENIIDFSWISRYYENDVPLLCNTPTGKENAALAYTVIKNIFPKISEDQRREGIISTVWPGRMEQILSNVYIDGAHNPGAMARIRQYLLKMGKDRIKKCHLMFAVCADKDYEKMIACLEDLPFATITITRTGNVRAAAVNTVASIVRNIYNGKVKEYDSLAEGFMIVRSMVEAKDDEWGLCIGSLYLVGEVKKLLKGEGIV